MYKQILVGNMVGYNGIVLLWRQIVLITLTIEILVYRQK